MKTDLARFRRILLGMAVGASFGLFIGAIVASWLLGRAAGDADIGRGTVLSVAVAILLAAFGGVIAARRHPEEDRHAPSDQ